jgi:hypothetical protein
MAYVGNGEVDILPDLDRGLAQAGFALSGATGGLDDFRRTYASPSGPVIRCCGSVGGLDSRPGWTGKWTSWAFFPIEYSELGAFAEGQLAMAIRQACVETRTMLGRSFHPGGGGGMDRSELDGRVDYVDWAQYYGPDVSAALGADRISDAGFHSVERLPNGAHAPAISIDGPSTSAGRSSIGWASSRGSCSTNTLTATWKRCVGARWEPTSSWNRQPARRRRSLRGPSAFHSARNRTATSSPIRSTEASNPGALHSRGLGEAPRRVAGCVRSARNRSGSDRNPGGKSTVGSRSKTLAPAYEFAGRSLARGERVLCTLST